jgi:hypothetical protein
MRRLSVVLLLLLTSLVLCGCDMHIDVLIHPDGTGTVAAELVELAENTDFIRRMPNMADYLNAWMDSLRQEGVLIDLSRRGNNEHIYLQRQTSSLAEMSSPPGLPAGVQTRTLAERQQEGDIVTYRYQVLVDTTSLYRVAPGANPDITSELHKQLNAVKATFSVTVPGRIVYTNANTVSANRATWNLQMNALTPIIVESQDTAQPAPRADSPVAPWIWSLAGMALVGGVVGLLVQMVQHWRARSRYGQ